MEFSFLLEMSFVAIMVFVKDSLSRPLRTACPEVTCNTTPPAQSNCKLVPNLYLYYGRLCVSCPKLQCTSQQENLKESFVDVVRSHILQSSKDIKNSVPKSRFNSFSKKSSLLRGISKLRRERTFGIRGSHSLRSSIFRERDSDEILGGSLGVRVPSF